MLLKEVIYMVERNVHGAWVIYGTIGVRQYYYMTKKDAVKAYKDEYARTVFTKK